ncbi:hypothetical protein LguiB_000806 [Lonicera macranthoides]
MKSEREMKREKEPPTGFWPKDPPTRADKRKGKEKKREKKKEKRKEKKEKRKEKREKKKKKKIFMCWKRPE